MAWEALFRVPWMGDFIRRNGVFPVDDLIADVGAYRAAARHLREGRPVAVFPEAGRSLPGGRMLPFLAGPFRLAVRFGCPVLPVTVNGSGRIFPRGPLLPRLRGGFEFVFHEPIPARAAGSGRNRDPAAEAAELARRARRAILGAYRAPAAALAASAAPEVLEPSEHPILRADREGVPLFRWLQRHPGWDRPAAAH
jgi:1-acyl-sn-glycerol-3-phosphate acyltransferase